MNYIYGDDRKQTKIEIMEGYVDNDSEVRIIDKIIDSKLGHFFPLPSATSLATSATSLGYLVSGGLW